MTKRFWLSTVLVTAIVASGCRMCCPSYDYCNPTNPGESQSISCGMVRQGSSLSGGAYGGEQVVYEEGTVIEGEPQLAPPNTAPEPDAAPEMKTTPKPNVIPKPPVPSKTRPSTASQMPTPAPPMVSRPSTSTPTKISSRRGA